MASGRFSPAFFRASRTTIRFVPHLWHSRTPQGVRGQCRDRTSKFCKAGVQASFQCLYAFGDRGIFGRDSSHSVNGEALGDANRLSGSPQCFVVG